jgi:hypothetical protein
LEVTIKNDGEKKQGDRHNEIGAPENGMIARRQS